MLLCFCYTELLVRLFNVRAAQQQRTRKARTTEQNPRSNTDINIHAGEITTAVVSTADLLNV